MELIAYKKQDSRSNISSSLSVSIGHYLLAIKKSVIQANLILERPSGEAGVLLAVQKKSPPPTKPRPAIGPYPESG
jgi:hypothetical protein